MNQIINTKLGVIIIIIIAITAGMFVWKWEKEKNIVLDTSQTNNENQIAVPSYKDKDGCSNPNGYFWCEEKQSCVQKWSENCGNPDIKDVSKWEKFDSAFNSKFHFSFKYPKSWFNPSD